jgi:hypothetical protein
LSIASGPDFAGAIVWCTGSGYDRGTANGWIEPEGGLGRRGDEPPPARGELPIGSAAPRFLASEHAAVREGICGEASDNLSILLDESSWLLEFGRVDEGSPPEKAKDHRSRFEGAVDAAIETREP